MVEAIIHGNGTYYKDGLERMYLHIRKADGHGLPSADGVTTPFTLVGRGHQYTGQLNARAGFDYLFVSPEVTDEQGGKHKLAYLLTDWGLFRAGRVQASVAGTCITLTV
jgi:hypothetical protein